MGIKEGLIKSPSTHNLFYHIQVKNGSDKHEKG